MNKLERLARDANSLRHVTLADEFQAFPVADWKAELARRAGAFDKAGMVRAVAQLLRRQRDSDE